MTPRGLPAGRVVYVTYDGLTDPLGEAQVVPQVRGLADLGFAFHVLSFEKPDRFRAGRVRIQAMLDEAGVEWVPQRFTARPRLTAKARDALRMRGALTALHESVGFDLVHCRSYPATGAALRLKRRERVPYVFDMRGFWVDERVEGGIWPAGRPHYAALYRHFKKRERAFLAGADGVVSLTNAAVREMRGWGVLPESDVEVIPCSVDLELFVAPRGDARDRARSDLGVPDGAFVLGFLGSLNNWCLLDDMMRFFAQVLERRPGAHFAFVTHDDVGRLRAAGANVGVPSERIHARSANRPEVPGLLAGFDVAVYFIAPTFSRIASSPTKMGELMAMGIPAITNAGVGDVDGIFAAHGAGLVVPDLSDASLHAAADRIDDVVGLPKEPMRAGARELFDLGKAVEAYEQVYRRIIQRSAT